MSQKVLVTGASSGFGQLTVNTLLEAGHTVIASMRDPNGRNRSVAEAFAKNGANIVEIDVTDSSMVERGVADALKEAGDIDVLVNNAGIGLLGLTEKTTVEQFQALFDINVLGVHRMTREILKHFHAKRTGYILNISSILGRITLPFYGPYNASKWALEALTENYRTELSSFSIDVGIVEPGGFPTRFMDSMLIPSDHSRDVFVGEFADAPQQSFEHFQQALAANPAQDPQLVADAVRTLIETPSGRRPFRTVVDKMGMGEPISAHNDEQAKLTRGIYQAFEMDGLLELEPSLAA
ncbi:MAG: SDR family oxidoreductase [Pseudomonadota bacterium]